MPSAHTLMALRRRAHEASARGDTYLASQLWYEHTCMGLRNKIDSAEKWAICAQTNLARKSWLAEAARLREELKWVHPPQRPVLVAPVTSVWPQVKLLGTAVILTLVLLRLCWVLAH
mgnify:CR=1 FL=1